MITAIRFPDFNFMEDEFEEYAGGRRENHCGHARAAGDGEFNNNVGARL